MAAHPLLFVPELLDYILDYSPGIIGTVGEYTDVDSASLVCTIWREVALAVRWRRPTLDRLLNFLAPLQEDGIGAVTKFSHPPNLEDWKRFERVAPHVRILWLCRKPRLSNAIIGEIQLTRPDITTPILPNLREVDTMVDCEVATINHILRLLPASLGELRVVLGGGVDQFLVLFPHRLPNLVRLSLHRMTSPHVDVLAASLPHLRSLRSISLDHVHLSSALVAVLATSPHLEDIQVSDDVIHPISSPQGLGRANFRWTRSSRAFPALTNLTALLDINAAVADLLSDIPKPSLAAAYSAAGFSSTRGGPEILEQIDWTPCKPSAAAIGENAGHRIRWNHSPVSRTMQ
ncbi:hypothetical protein FRB93_012591 [Tulasnella sp. JGI-2019a]|nr:hypothetical protein FRB93_012591 [Tulasnella sp. JGI-2019a]